MAKVFIQESTLTSIGDAIRAKTGKTALIDPANMSAEIASITTGGGDDGEFRNKVLHLTGNCAAKFAYGGWNWVLNDYGSQITSENVTDVRNLFANNEGDIEPDFDLNMKSWREAFRISNFANYAYSLKKVPSIKFPISTVTHNVVCDGYVDLNYAFNYCYKLTDLDNLYSAEALEYLTKLPLTVPWGWYTSQMIIGCTSLRHLPDWYYNLHPNWETSAAIPDGYNLSYCLPGNHSLEEILNMPVWRAGIDGEYSTLTSDAFSGGDAYQSCYRLARYTFETNDGAPITAKWSGQTLGFSRYTGWADWYDIASLTNGITKAHKVTDDASYQALKNDPNWWTQDVAYSRYNRTSAVETINSLPDTSAFVAETGTPNTIIFKADAGSATDGGACGNLTEEEIAVAAAKGWTVTFE